MNYVEYFVSKGHAVDFALHMKEGNPHADFFVPQMKFDENGELIMPKVKLFLPIPMTRKQILMVIIQSFPLTIEMTLIILTEYHDMLKEKGGSTTSLL